MSIEPQPHDRARGFSLVLAGSTPTSEAEQGTLSTDMARVGVCDRRAFLATFGGDGEALAEWPERATGRSKPGWGGFLRHTKSGLEALYVDMGSDGRCSVRLLRSGKKTVGVRVVPHPSAARPADEPGSRHWTWVVVKCRGVADTWDLCDAREYEPDFEDLLDDIVSEAGADGPDAPIASCLPRFRGVERMSV